MQFLSAFFFGTFNKIVCHDSGNFFKTFDYESLTAQHIYLFRCPRIAALCNVCAIGVVDKAKRSLNVEMQINYQNTAFVLFGL